MLVSLYRKRNTFKKLKLFLFRFTSICCIHENDKTKRQFVSLVIFFLLRAMKIIAVEHSVATIKKLPILSLQ